MRGEGMAVSKGMDMYHMLTMAFSWVLHEVREIKMIY
jgi:hypothetical protein